MNRATANSFLVHQCYVIARNRGFCSCASKQNAHKMSSKTSDAMVLTRWKRKRRLQTHSIKFYKLTASSFNCWTQTNGDVIKSQLEQPTPSSSSASSQFLLQKRKLHLSASSCSLDELMKPVAENIVRPPETNYKRTYELEPAEKKAHVETYLDSLLDVYVGSGRVEEAQEILLFHHLLGRSEPSAPILDNVALYNTVLKGWSRKGDWAVLKELLDMMVRDGPKPNLQSYAAGLECAARTGDKELKGRAQELLKTMTENGLMVDNIYKYCHFVSDQRELVLQAVRTVYSDFQLTPQKNTGHGVCSLTRGLHPVTGKGSSLSTPPLPQFHKDAAEMQFRLELQGKTSMNAVGKGQGHWHEVLQKCEASWRQSLTEEFRDRVVNFGKSSSMMGIRGLSLKPYLEVLNYEEYVSMMLEEIEYLGTHGHLASPKELYKILGIKVMDRYHLQNKQNNGVLKKTQLLYGDYCKYYYNTDLHSQYTPQEYWAELLTRHVNGPDIDCPEIEWPVRLQIEVGLFLYKILKKTKIDLKLVKRDIVNLKKRYVPLLPKVFSKDLKIRTDEFEVNGSLNKIYRNVFLEEVKLTANFLPMMSPPMPWTSYCTGGFLLSSAPFVRLAALGSEEQQMRIKKKSVQQLSSLFEAVNYLSRCPWIINTRILDLMVSIFTDGGNLDLGIPPKSSPLLRISYADPDMTEEEVETMKSRNSQVRQQRSRLKRLWNKLFQALTVATHYRDRIMWFPHTLDFRGRVYPFPNYIRHIEGDTIRSLMMFAEGKPLGPKGLDWLKLHLVNLTGLKKTACLNERLSFCDEMRTEIEDSADQPLTGSRWWAQTKEPWQALATCVEITNAQRSNNPEEYVCHLPVHQDGSSNGLQHYAALGRDTEGARLVNLSEQEIPQDIYSEVARAIEEERIKDTADGLELAQTLEGHIQRNIVKETVMTTVNGIISRNSRLRIESLLRESDYPSERAAEAAEYISSKAHSSTRAIFKVSSEIQKWLMECAVQITQVSGRPVEWETPLGFPVVQPYLVPEKKWNDCNSENEDENPEYTVMKKQRRAFPPNYIQSLESTHLMLTAIFCEKAGLTFAAVHDSYWTHPSTVDVMNKICREQFVRMHSMPLLETLAEEMVKTYCDRSDLKDPSNRETLRKVLCAVPEKGNFDLREVLKSTYFFS